MLNKIELVIDDADYTAIQRSISKRQTWRILPDADEAGTNIAGRVIAEICRGWEEYHDMLSSMREERKEDGDGEDWKVNTDDAD